MTKQPFVVVFAGVPGTSKSIIANYLSGAFNLPIFNNDELRFEVQEDLRVDNIRVPKALAEYERRSAERRSELLMNGNSLIFDCSVDRRWGELKAELLAAGYSWLMIDMELSKTFLKDLFHATGRDKFVTEELHYYLEQHADFMEQYASDISVRITDETFSDRLELSAAVLREFLLSLE